MTSRSPSARTLASNDAPCGIPSLPSELLTAIFRYLTWVPYGIEPSDLGPEAWCSTAWMENKLQHRECVSEIVTKWGMVCKSWYWLLSPFLAEWITLRHTEHLPQILSLVRSPTPWSNTNNLGWYAKRLDIAITRDQGPLEEKTLTALVQVIQRLRNLEVFTLKTNTTFSRMTIDPRILHALSPKLRVITWLDGYRLPPTAEAWSAFLVSHPNLTSICPPFQTRTIWSPPNSPSPIAPSLEHVFLRDAIGYPDYPDLGLLGYLPSLKRVTLSRLSSGSILPRNVNLLKAHRTTLTNVILCLPHIQSEAISTLQAIYDSSPHLIRVDLIIERWDRRSVEWHFPPSVKEVGVRVRKRGAARVEDVLAFLVWITRLSRGKSQEPGMVQFLDDHNTDQMLVHCAVLVKNTQWIITSWQKRNGELLDLMSLKGLVDIARRAETNVRVRESRFRTGNAVFLQMIIDVLYI
ncbi:hypothetical protein P691DRAFT_765093 [Macrolepiota fuliginosa MF-IS2]|uniref:Uncharacterized protein n=1 Tax=Macrolepiota fuliginosa MF-IS2 TaxID=1400762 RepID=A0A9P5X2S8_9AGAR|nr:hypothetical protein P691DRAFT_766053 [Macrolepiota fuliginosa MF-IS2]KAF9442559.1 hypothetical protein P691DRAFT_765093 [Macrolepiota fuliginosa MF-IS2]